MKKRYCLRASLSPTYYNLCDFLQKNGWCRTRLNWLANFNEDNFNFDVPAAECLELKNLLAELVAKYCPEVMPITYCINDQNWPFVLQQISREYEASGQSLDHIVWILKPAFLNNGRHIKIFPHLNQLTQHYRNANRLGGEHVLEQYVLYPHLLKGPQQGHKYSIRMFVVLTNYAGVYLYPYGYFNIALHPYDPNEFTDMRAHLTNEHLKEDEYNVVQIPTQQYDLFKPLYPQIKTIITAVMDGLHKQHSEAFVCKKRRALAIFGFDFIVDNDLRVWLLEANHGPCFPISDDHPLQKKLYNDFWQAFIASFVLPIAMNLPADSIKYQLFEKI